ncbi:hypothetical protein LJC68_05050 [Bacteroidales bacterium OttesenSCG-928-B11]|nr:hypothetical protein [Bacteroidales bacterium OttesenSCG-928-C03]MDL2312224.1 hypothetical protein [Bacteroidales bacterium OttesenSCG-928-B11]MDL2326957.1 hypothetical protein [Bacteroidales bacterium OttesenSCG-928-A14]
MFCRKIIAIICFSSMIYPVFGQLLSKDSLDKLPIYTSLDAALQDASNVYRLHIKWTRMDSLPLTLFTLTNLQELSITNCKLLILNQDISRLENLQYITLYKNRLVRLPDEICNLKHLRYLDVNRNLLNELPQEIGHLHNLTEINAWGNYFFTLPESITNLKDTLKKIDLRQIQFRREEIEFIEKQLPKTNILYTNICDCKNSRK